jgi:hypothetical protein
MLRSFNTGAKLRAMLDREDVTPILAQVNVELEKALETKTRGPVDMDLLDPRQRAYDVVDQASLVMTPLCDETILIALQRMHPSHVQDMTFWCIPPTIVMTSGHEVRGACFTTKKSSRSESKASSIIYFIPASSDGPIPGQIEYAFSLPFRNRSTTRLYHFFGVRRYEPRSDDCADLFLSDFPGFGARIFSSELAGQIEVIRSSMVFSHAWQRSWDDDHVVCKSLNRVSTVVVIRR